MRELAEDGYSGVEVRVTPTRTEIIILATRTQNVLGEKGRRIRELTAVVQKRFNFPENTVEVGLSFNGFSSFVGGIVRLIHGYYSVCSFMPRRSLTEVSAPLLSASPSATSSSEVWLSEGETLDRLNAEFNLQCLITYSVSPS